MSFGTRWKVSPIPKSLENLSGNRRTEFGGPLLAQNNRRFLLMYLRQTVLALTLVLAACGGATVASEPMAEDEVEIASVTPLPVDDSVPPIFLAIPEIELETTIVPMGWRVVANNGERTTEWEIPYRGVGWHVTSAGAGAAGNTVVSGHQVVGEAVFAPLALGEVEEGQLIHLTSETDQTFVYRVTEVTEPIPLVGATEEDAQTAEAYVAPSDEARLTLITGWPDFSTTHLLFVTAELVGAVDGR